MSPVIETGAGNAPSVGIVAGLGLGGGAGVLSPASEAACDVAVLAGRAPLSAGSVQLVFKAPPRFALAVSAEETFGPVTLSNDGLAFVVAWSEATFVPGSRYLLHFGWSK